MNSNPFEDNTIQKIQENGIYYYILPEGFSLFKATQNYDIRSKGLKLDPTGSYFFGVKNMHPDYIESYEEEYGIIFEFKTRREYKLLALDEIATQQYIYDVAAPEIQDILVKNYGYNNENRKLVRDSESDKDHILSQYLCSNNYDGYAVHNMSTDRYGLFHDEFMICKMDGIKYVKQITTDEEKIQNILQNAELKRHAKNMKELKKQNQQTFFDSSPIKGIKTNLFGDDDEDDEEENKGGKKKRTYKKRSNKTRNISKRRKTSKRNARRRHR